MRFPPSAVSISHLSMTCLSFIFPPFFVELVFNFENNSFLRALRICRSSRSTCTWRSALCSLLTSLVGTNLVQLLQPRRASLCAASTLGNGSNTLRWLCTSPDLLHLFDCWSVMWKRTASFLKTLATRQP